MCFYFLFMRRLIYRSFHHGGFPTTSDRAERWLLWRSDHLQITAHVPSYQGAESTAGTTDYQVRNKKQKQCCVACVCVRLCVWVCVFDCVWERVHRGQTSELAFFVLFSGILFNIKWKHGQGCIKWLVHVTFFNFFFQNNELVFNENWPKMFGPEQNYVGKWRRQFCSSSTADRTERWLLWRSHHL